MTVKKVLTIAGSDCSGGAGIQADLKTIAVHKMYGMSVITALTAQNTMGVIDVADATPDFVAKQLDCVFSDIFPDAVKIGMVSNQEIIAVIAQKLKQYGAKNIVVDPVMISTSGSNLISPNALKTLTDILLPMGDIITPNIAEAEALSKTKIFNKDDMQKCAKIIAKAIEGCVLIKGGHFDYCADDLLYDNENFYWFEAQKLANTNTHGTGCTLSSAIACNLADNQPMQLAVKNAKQYVFGAIQNGLDIGKGRGPLNHTYILK